MEIKYILYEITKISLVVLITYISYYYYKYFTRENPLPGPFPLPFIGSIHQVLRNFNFDANKLLKYGEISEVYIGSQRFILCNNGELIQPMMKSVINGSFHNRVKDDHEGLIDGGLYNVGLVFNNNFNDWHYYRKFFNKVTLSPGFIKLSVTAVQNSFFEMEKYWEKLGEETVLDFSHWSRRYFCDTIFLTTTNKPAYTLAHYYNKLTQNEKLSIPDNILKEGNKFLEAQGTFLYSVSYFYFVPRIFRNFPGINRYTQYFKDSNDWLKNNIHEIIKSRREEIKKTPIDQKLKSDMMTMFLTVNTERDVTTRIADDLHDEPISDVEIIPNFIEAMTAGSNSGANSICFLVYFLEKYPKVKQRMIEEIERVLGKDPNSLLTFESISKLEYVEAIVKEAARIYPLIPIDVKRNSAPEIIGGYEWSKDTMFIVNFDRIHNHELYWKDPEVFNPDRFMDKNNPASKSHFYMFGGGLRKCPGRNLAITEIKATLAMLYRKYDIQMMGPMKKNIKSIRKCEELKVKLKKRKNL